MRLNQRTKLLSLGLSGVLAVGIIGGAGVAIAQQPGNGNPGSGQQGGTDRLGERGEKLDRITVAQLIKASGLDKERVLQALKDGKSLREIFAANGVDTQAVVQTVLGQLESRLRMAVQEDKLTAEQAQKILAAAREALPNILDHPAALGGVDFNPGPEHRLGKASLNVAADAIGISPQDLLKELRGGQTIAQVAVAHNVPVQTVINEMVAAANAAIDKAAAEGKIKPENVSRAKEKALAAITKLVNEGRPPR